MKWFKHFTDWRMDRDICEAERVLNLPGYRFYITLKEIYGEHFNELDYEGYLEYNYRILKEKLKISERKMMKLLIFFKGKERIDYEINGESIRIKIHEFIRLANNWEQRRNIGFVEKISKMIGTEERRTEDKEDGRKEEETDEFVFSISQKILDDLNTKAKKNFSEKSFIVQQIRNGKKPEDFFIILDNKIKDPFFQKNPKLYNPKTLFGDEHFDTYLNERTNIAKPEERKERDGAEKEDIPYETVRKIYKAYLDTELSATQEALHYIINNYDIDDVIKEIYLIENMYEISVVSIEEKIIFFTESTPALKGQIWNLLEK